MYINKEYISLNTLLTYAIIIAFISLFVAFNFELPTVIYYCIKYLFFEVNNKYNILNNILYSTYFIFAIFLIALFLFFLSCITSMLIFIFELNNVYSVIYAINNVSSVMFVPTILFIIHSYNLPYLLIILFNLIYLISDLVVLSNDFFNIEVKTQLLILKQYTNSIIKKKDLFTYHFFYEFKSLIYLYFADIIDDAHLYTFALQHTIFFKIIENISVEANMNNEFIVIYIYTQMIIYILFSIISYLIKI